MSMINNYTFQVLENNIKHTFSLKHKKIYFLHIWRYKISLISSLRLSKLKKKNSKSKMKLKVYYESLFYLNLVEYYNKIK